VRIGTPLIELTRIVYDQSGQGVEHLHALYRPDRYAFEIDLIRSGKRDRAWSPVPRRANRVAEKVTKQPISRSKAVDQRPLR
jgi:GntR family transcriptional regulator